MQKHTKTKKTSGATIWLYGKHAVLAAINNPARQCLKLLATTNSAKELTPVLAKVRPNLHITLVDSTTITSKFAIGTAHQNLALETSLLPNIAIEDVISTAKSDRSVIVMLDQISDPYNVGSILRSAAAFGADCVISTIDHMPGETATLAKSASGALEIIPILRVINMAKTIMLLKNSGYWIIGLDGYAAKTLQSIALPAKAVFILGAEDTGMRRLTKEQCDFLAKLPICSDMESLNVSNATAIALYEFNRQHLI